MLTLSSTHATRQPAPFDLVLDAFIDTALDMTPRQALARLCEPKDHLPPEVAAYIDDLMRWVIEMDRERAVPAD